MGTRAAAPQTSSNAAAAAQPAAPARSFGDAAVHARRFSFPRRVVVTHLTAAATLVPGK